MAAVNDDSRTAATALRAYAFVRDHTTEEDLLAERLRSGQSTIVSVDYLRALEKVAAKSDEHCASRGRTTIPGIADALVELDKVKP
jgi:hypothetical protein